MTDHIARLYLDVDGVLNAVSGGVPQWGWDDEPVRVTVNGWRITYSPAVVALLNEIAQTPGLDVFWLTTWCHDAPTKLAPAIGLQGKDWPVVGFDHWRGADAKIWWKLPAIQEHMDGFEGGVLWIDDDIRFDPPAMVWLRDQPAILAMTPDTEVGITQRQGVIIREFVTRILRPAEGKPVQGCTVCATYRGEGRACPAHRVIPPGEGC